MLDPFNAFITWVKLDARQEAHQAAIAQLSREIQAINDQLHEQKVSQEHAHKHVTDAKKRLDQQELDIRTLRSREKKITAQRDASNSTKEYLSLDAEIAKIAQELPAHEDTLFVLFEQYETLQKNYAERVITLTEQHAELTTRKTALEHAITRQREELDAAQREYASRTPEINPEFAALFFQRKKLVTNPVIPESSGHCSACFYMVLSQDMVRLRKHQLVECKNCYRLLYSDT